MNASATVLSSTPSLPIAQTVSVPPTDAAGLTAGAWAADAPGPLLAFLSLVPHAAKKRLRLVGTAKAPAGRPAPPSREMDPWSDMSHSCAATPMRRLIRSGHSTRSPVTADSQPRSSGLHPAGNDRQPSRNGWQQRAPVVDRGSLVSVRARLRVQAAHLHGV